MRKLFDLVIWMFAIVISLIAIVFIVIETRLIFSLDWSIYDSPINGLIRHLLRLVIMTSTLALCVLDVLNLFKKNKTLSFYLVIGDIALIIGAIFACCYGTNYVGVVCISGAVLKLLGKLSFIQFNKIQK